MNSLSVPTVRFMRGMVAAVILLGAPALCQEKPVPDRKAFLGEVLDARPTPVTPEFNSYRSDSYRITNEDLFKGLTEEAAKRKMVLKSVTILGPMTDPLWTSYVVVCFQEGEKVRVNSLIMPHARITGKATGLITTVQYKAWLKGVLSKGVFQKKTPVVADGENKKDASLSEYTGLLMVDPGEDGKNPDVYRAHVAWRKTWDKKQEETVTGLFEQYNSLLKDLKQTYPVKTDDATQGKK